MEFEKDDSYRDMQALHDKCRRCLYYHANLTMKDGSTVDGLIENVDPDRIIVLVGEDVIDRGDDNDEYSQQRQYHPAYGRPHRYPMRYRRFRRQAFPLASLAALSLLPYPYITPPYPYMAFNPYFY